MAYTRKMAGKVPVLKQDLVFDETPTPGSENAVTSGGVANAIGTVPEGGSKTGADLVDGTLAIDGAGSFRIFGEVVLPLSKAIIAVMALYYAVGQWNSYFNAMIFLQNENLYPLQLVLKEILIASESTVGGSGETILQQYRLANQLKYVSVIVSSVPVLMLYPFVQKYFAQGVMIGSLKG